MRKREEMSKKGEGGKSGRGKEGGKGDEGKVASKRARGKKWEAREMRQEGGNACCVAEGSSSPGVQGSSRQWHG